MYFALIYDVVDQFVARGEVVMGGALGDPPDGAMLIFKGPSATAAEDFARRDPYVTNGLVTRWQVRPWNVVIGP